MDVIANMLTAIRNAGVAGKEKVDIPGSKLKMAIAGIMKDEGYIKNVKEISDKRQGVIRILLKYDDGDRPVIREIKRFSRGSLRQYRNAKELPRVKNGMGTAIVSTSHGVLSDRTARKKNIGGEVLCTIW